ncbi:MAG: serine/threonine protein kinase bacterial [Limisphaerales bacterium]|nr:MAG: serine/threonine protein kinase bacterial [Limisphaerales bacterium]KAG0507904.1 MAG: serine/threonine protein kinase bacterial [Limisphaerales bacterium]TXT50001.1 MAG: serine/threonine protein kinase bacterial [Limisphaerales bacterium]
MNHPPQPNTCPQCSAVLPADAPQGLCPACLLAAVALPTEAGTAAPAKAPAPTREQVATAFPQLEILELIGAGGMGYVFKARQPKLDRLVALKLLPQHLGADAAFAGRFEREGRVLARLSHPNIVTVHDFGFARAGDWQSPFPSPRPPTDGDYKSPALPLSPDAQPETPNSQPGTAKPGFYYLLMEFVDGVNLRQAMRAGRFTPVQALEVVPKICEALQFAHEQGILHRDIKPENILLDAKGRVKLVDFGIAKLVDDGRAELPPGLDAEAAQQRGPATLTSATAALGTPSYMAPEQRDHPAEVDHRADIYSLGVVFYEMLTGELPVGKFAPPSAKSASDPRVDEVVLRALEQQRERRQQSAGEVKTQVETIAASSSSAGSGRAKAPMASQVRYAAGLAIATAWPVGLFLASMAALKSRPQETMLMVGVNGASVVGALGVIGFLLRRKDPEPPKAARWGALLAVVGLILVPAIFFGTRPWLNVAGRKAYESISAQFLEASRQQTAAGLARARLERWQSATHELSTQAEVSRRIADLSATEVRHRDTANKHLQTLRSLPDQPSTEIKWLMSLAGGLALAGLVCGLVGQFAVQRRERKEGASEAAFAVLALPTVAGLFALLSWAMNLRVPAFTGDEVRYWFAGLSLAGGVIATGVGYWVWLRLTHSWDWGRAALVLVLTGGGVALLLTQLPNGLKRLVPAPRLLLEQVQITQGILRCNATPLGLPDGWAVALRGMGIGGGRVSNHVLFNQAFDRWMAIQQPFSFGRITEFDEMNAVERGPLILTASSTWPLAARPDAEPQVLLVLTNKAGDGLRIEAQLVPVPRSLLRPAEQTNRTRTSLDALRARVQSAQDTLAQYSRSYGTNDYRVHTQARFVRDLESMLARKEAESSGK